MPVNSELESDLVTIMSGVDKSSMPPFMKLFWDEQQKYLKSPSKGIRYHPMIIRYCLGLAALQNHLSPMMTYTMIKVKELVY